MLKKHLTLALSALLAVAGCAPCALAQSGRRTPRAYAGRGLSGRGAEASETEAAREDATKVTQAADGRAGRAADFDLRSLNASRSASVVYAEDGEKHPNKADKIAGVALLGYLILWIAITARSDGYAPTGSYAPKSGLHLRQ